MTGQQQDAAPCAVHPLFANPFCQTCRDRTPAEDLNPLDRAERAHGAARRASVDELLGADPDWLGGQSVDDYMAEIRRDRYDNSNGG